MLLNMLKAKLHRGTITEANLNYVGSITIDKELLEKSNILEGEKVQVLDIDNGARLETYTIAGEVGSGIICLNGAAARLVQPGDKVIIISYGIMKEEEAKNFKPTILILDEHNKIIGENNKEEHGEVF